MEKKESEEKEKKTDTQMVDLAEKKEEKTTYLYSKWDGTSSPPCKEVSPYEYVKVLYNCGLSSGFSFGYEKPSADKDGPLYTPPPGVPGMNAISPELNEWTLNHLPVDRKKLGEIHRDLIAEHRINELKEQSKVRTQQSQDNQKQVKSETVKSTTDKSKKQKRQLKIRTTK